MKKCPYCAEEIQDESILCRHCKSDLRPVMPPQADDATLNIRYMQMKKSVGIAILLNCLWAGAGIYYAKSPEGRFIVWVNIPAFLFSLFMYGIPSLALCIWSSIICYNYIQIYNYELLKALQTQKLDDFSKKHALL